MSQRRLAPLLILATVAVLLFFLPAGNRLLVDWWWFREIGYQIVFTRELVATVALFLGAGGLSAGVLYLNLRMAQRGLVPEPMVWRLGETTPRVDVTAGLRRLSLPIALGIGLLAGLAATQATDTLLQFIYRTPFGVADPIFSRDIGFYVFTLPALSWVIGFLYSLALISLFIVVPVYWLRGDVVARVRRLMIEPTAGLHIAILLAALFLLTALRLWLVAIPNLLFSSTGPLFGASFTDVQARLPALRVTAVAAGVVAVIVVVGALRRQLPVYGLRAVVGYLALVLIGRGLIPAAIQKLVVAPTELTREAPVSGAPHRRHPPGVGARQRGDPRPARRGRSRHGRHQGQRTHHRQRAAVGPGPAAARPSGSCRRSAPTTTSSRWTTTATGSTASTGRCCCRRASSTRRRSPRARSSTSTSPSRTAWDSP